MTRLTPTATVAVPAQLGAAPDLSRWLHETLGSSEFGPVPMHALLDIGLAVHELWVNSVEHGGATDPVQVTATRLVGSVQIELLDNGRTFDPAAVPEPDADDMQVRGFGLFLVRKLVDASEYERVPDGNLWKLVKEC